MNEKNRSAAALWAVSCVLALVMLVTCCFVLVSAERLSDAASADIYGTVDCSVLFGEGKDGKYLTDYISPGGDVVIDKSVTAIASGAFNGTRLGEAGVEIDSVYIPDPVKIIDSRAFYATSAEEIRLPENIEYIGSNAFADSQSLKKVYFDKKPDHHVEFAPDAFAGTENVEFVNFPDDVVISEDNMISYK